MKYIIFLLILTSCSTLDKDRFFRQSVGRYSLNTDGVLFLRRELGYTDVVENTTIEFRGNGDIDIIFSETESRPLAKFVELKRDDEGVFSLVETNAFIAMGYLASSPLPFWLSSTNTFPTADSVLLEHLLPIATQVAEN